jgi:hypothetical protein
VTPGEQDTEPCEEETNDLGFHWEGTKLTISVFQEGLPVLCVLYHNICQRVKLNYPYIQGCYTAYCLVPAILM